MRYRMHTACDYRVVVGRVVVPRARSWAVRTSLEHVVLAIQTQRPSDIMPAVVVQAGGDTRWGPGGAVCGQ